jgi:hypothetical protein
MKAKAESKSGAAAPAAPVDAFLKASNAWTAMTSRFMEGWQRQLDANVHVMEAMREARSPLDVWTVQCNWMMESTARGLASWKDLFEAANAAQANLWTCLQEEAQQAAGGIRAIGEGAVTAPPGSLAPPDLVKTALVTFDAAYGRMLKNSQQMMAAATEAMGAGVRHAQPAAEPAAKPAAKRGPA